MLKDLNLKHVYDSTVDDIMKDLVIPLLENSTVYYRGVGYFTSGWLKLSSEGLARFVENGGKVHYIVSPILKKEDWEAIKLGNEALINEALKKSLLESIKDLADSLRNNTLNTLAWMIADKVVEFRFAIPRNNIGDYHDKVAMFEDDEGNIVIFHGSFNDSMKAMLNGEAVSVFKSWDSSQSDYISIHRKRLLDLWNGKNNQLIILKMPAVARDELIKLRSSARPYHLDSRGLEVTKQKGPKCPIELRDYQEEAAKRWLKTGKGILEMATGTGKTITALTAAVKKWEELRRLAIIITVPYIHLMDQWEVICRKFGFETIKCSGDVGSWSSEMRKKIIEFRHKVIDNLCIITVVNTASKEKFLSLINKLPKEEKLFIGDEVHVLGATKFQRAMLNNADFRFGLSATPWRWFDKKGTRIIYDYFGEVIFEYGLDKAIKNGYLAEYLYFPITVTLTENEEKEYEELTNKLKPFLNTIENEEKEYEGLANKLGPSLSNIENEEIKKLLIKRARIISNASQKKKKLISLIDELKEKTHKENKEIKHILFYCPPGKHREILKIVAQSGLKAHEFVHNIASSERIEILKKFSGGDIQALIAIKCLDEGVDVPATETAVFLASTTNPREFIQRRGRILRLYQNKKLAYIYDFIVVPSSKTKASIALSLLRHEMPRFAEFSDIAVNKFGAREKLRSLLDEYGVLHFLDMKPWDIYHEMRRKERG